jgi:glutamate synthase domain-containing protein 3
MVINAINTHYAELNKMIRDSEENDIVIHNVLGQRYIGCGLKDKNIEVHGTSGNALGAYMNGGTVEIFGNAQDATGDTMNSGKIIIHGNCGDTTGYGMRGGTIFIRGNAGYRIGIHMKEYKEMKPAIVVGGRAGDFLGEYQAGGVIIVLGLDSESQTLVGNYCGTGMHGGTIYLRTENIPSDLPVQVNVSQVTEEDKKIIRSFTNEFCYYFGHDAEKVLNHGFIKLKANTKNPYRQLYTNN